MKEFLKRLLHSRYVGLLEGEVARLRSENRALTNSLLGTAGFPPVDYPASNAQPREIPRTRKRSWHQIQAWRESEAGKPDVAADEFVQATGTFVSTKEKGGLKGRLSTGRV
jgi:hypothetical protein